MHEMHPYIPIFRELASTATNHSASLFLVELSHIIKFQMLPKANLVW
jgi:hypothetical protein